MAVKCLSTFFFKNIHEESLWVDNRDLNTINGIGRYSNLHWRAGLKERCQFT